MAFNNGFFPVMLMPGSPLSHVGSGQSYSFKRQSQHRRSSCLISCWIAPFHSQIFTENFSISLSPTWWSILGWMFYQWRRVKRTRATTDWQIWIHICHRNFSTSSTVDGASTTTSPQSAQVAATTCRVVLSDFADEEAAFKYIYIHINLLF